MDQGLKRSENAPGNKIDRILDRALLGLMFVVIMALLILLVRVGQYGYSHVLGGQFVGCGLLLMALEYRRTHSSDVALGVIAGLILIVAALALVRFGLASPALVILAVLPLIAGAVRGVLPALTLGVLMTAAIVVIGLLHSQGRVKPSVDINILMQDPVNWIVNVVAYDVMVGWGSVMTARIVGYWRESLGELEAAQDQMMRERELVVALQRKESISQLSSGVAHDFNNVLAVVMSNIELAQEISDQPDKKQLFDQSMNAALSAAEKGSDLSHADGG